MTQSTLILPQMDGNKILSKCFTFQMFALKRSFAFVQSNAIGKHTKFVVDITTPFPWL